MKKLAKTTGLIFLIALYILVFTMPAASAYIDPSATTFLIQAIAGIAIAVGSVAVIFWRRAKKKIKDKVGIKERMNYNTGSGKNRVPTCPAEKEEAIMDAFRHFHMI